MSKLRDNVEIPVVIVFPCSFVAEVWVVNVLSAALRPSNRLHFGVPPEDSRVYTHQISNAKFVHDEGSEFKWSLATRTRQKRLS